ncbi:hypothetical protein BSL78_04881, partial [Apostichopus japonicus]
AISVFKTGWCTCHPSWHHSDLAVTFEVLLAVRQAFHSAVTSSSSRDHDVVIQTKSEALLSLLERVQSEDNSCISQLSEIMMASFVSITSDYAKLDSEGSVQVEAKVLVANADNNKVVPSDYTLVIQEASHHRCERCRKYTAPIPGQPCNRCIKVLSEGWE